jgi:hypothetical protein
VPRTPWPRPARDVQPEQERGEGREPTRIDVRQRCPQTAGRAWRGPAAMTRAPASERSAGGRSMAPRRARAPRRVRAVEVTAAEGAPAVMLRLRGWREEQARHQSEPGSARAEDCSERRVHRNENATRRAGGRRDFSMDTGHFTQHRSARA